MKYFKDIYETNSLFYWCNCIGEINMPGDGNVCIPHRADELPPAVRNVYEKYWCDAVNAKRYVVTFEGQVGILLEALYNETYAEDTTKVNEKTHEFSVLMAKIFDYLCGKAAMLDFFTASSGCTSLVGEYSDPDGHELALFIPVGNKSAKEIIECINSFESCIYTDEDIAFMKAAATRL